MAGRTSPFPPRPEKRSPFPRKSLPQAGESLREAAFDLFFDKFLIYLTMALTFAIVAAMEWIMRWLDRPLSPWVWTLFAAALGVLATWRWFRIKPQLAMLRQGIRGEREVGRMLEELRALGYVVFHDIPGEGFNVDHALIGPAGVFAIETKTLTMPSGRRATVDYDGKRVLVDGKMLDRDPLIQAQAVADFLRDLLKRMSNREVTVRPVVLFPGWWVTPQPRDCRAWVLNPKAMRAFLTNEAARLSQEDIALFADRLTLHLSAE